MSFSLLNYAGIPKDIHLAVAKLPEDPARVDKDEVTELLDPAEREQYRAMKNERRKNEFLSTRHLVKGLADKFGLLEQGFKIKKDTMGKPYGEAGGSHIYLSIAHCTREVMCGLSESMDLGVDLEPMERKVNKGLGKRIYHPEEQEEITGLDLIRVWTIKESLVKLDGKGLRTNLNDLLLSRSSESEFSCIFNNEKSARICSFEYDDHWVSVAYFA